jgi:hypothetical protein
VLTALVPYRTRTRRRPSKEPFSTLRLKVQIDCSSRKFIRSEHRFVAEPLIEDDDEYEYDMRLTSLSPLPPNYSVPRSTRLPIR